MVQIIMIEVGSPKSSNSNKLISIILGLPWVEIATGAWKFARKILRGLSNEGMYEVLDYESTLMIQDTEGKKATIAKRQKVRYLQDNIIAYQDQGWGDGTILLDYQCSPGKAVDRYHFGHKEIVLISLQEAKNKGMTDEFDIHWEIENGFVNEKESWATLIQHRTRNLRINIIFPQGRSPKEAYLVEGNSRRRHQIDSSQNSKLSDGRWQIKWESQKLKLYESYIIEWIW